jgi:acetyl esterase/lipase
MDVRGIIMRAFPAFLVASLALTPPAMAQEGMKELRAAEALVVPPTLVERYGPDDLRSGELRLPEGKGPFPVVILVHGGCWTASFDTRKGVTPLAEALRGRGVAVWNIEYRRIGDAGAGWPGTFEDVAAGVDHVAALAKRYPLDLKRVAFVGHSAGAHLALWAASRSKLSGALKAKGVVNPVSVVAIDGPGMLAPFIGPDAQVCGEPVIVPLMGGTPTERPDAYRAATPGANLPLGVRQLLVEAELGPFMTDYAAAAKASGDAVVELPLPTANHFDIITPATANGTTVVDFILTKAF